MEDNELYLWLATIKQAKEGVEEAKIDLKVDNEFRTKEGRPTVEEEILSILDEEKEKRVKATREKLLSKIYVNKTTPMQDEE